MIADMPTTRPAVLRLPMTFDAERLKRDLETAHRFSWAPEEPFGIKDFVGSDVTIFHDGQWKGLALRSQGGEWQRTDPGGPGLEPYAETEILEHTPYFRELVESFHCPLRTVRLSSLPPGVHIGEHCDTYHDFRYGQVRLHVPVVTHPDVLFMVAGERCEWKEGELWYGDFSRLHRVENNSPINRIHLVIDAAINDWLLSLFPDEFVDQVRAGGAVYFEEPIDLPAEELKRYECDFVIPAGLMRGMFEMDDGIPGEFAGHIRFDDGQLVMYVDERPLIALYPVERDRFCMVGWVPERSIRFTTDGEKVAGMEMVMHHGHDSTSIRFHLPSAA